MTDFSSFFVFTLQLEGCFQKLCWLIIVLLLIYIPKIDVHTDSAKKNVFQHTAKEKVYPSQAIVEETMKVRFFPP